MGSFLEVLLNVGVTVIAKTWALAQELATIIGRVGTMAISASAVLERKVLKSLGCSPGYFDVTEDA
jgi:hypothetical protein